MGDVGTFSGAGDRVIYLADQDTDQVIELYSVRITGGMVTKLNGPLPVGGDVVEYSSFFAAISGIVVYLADQNTNNRFAVYSVPITGGTSTRISEPLPGLRTVTGFDVSGNGMVAYLADGIGNPDELFSVSATGVGTVDKLNDAPVTGGNVSNFPDTNFNNSFALPLLAPR